MKIKYWGAVAVGTLAALALAAPAAAQKTDSETLTVDISIGEDCGTAEVTFTNPNDFPFWGDYRLTGDEGVADPDVDGDIPSINWTPDQFKDWHNHGVTPDQQLTQGTFAGETFGLQYNPVLILPGDTAVVDVEVEKSTELQARIWRGPNQAVYVPWTDLVKVEACASPSPSPTVTASPAPTATGAPETTAPPAGGKGGGELAQTGASLPALIGGGVVLAGLGGGAYLLARRRRVTFTA